MGKQVSQEHPDSPHQARAMLILHCVSPHLSFCHPLIILTATHRKYKDEEIDRESICAKRKLC